VQTSGTPFIYEQWFNNNSSLSDSTIFSYTHSVENSYSWTFTDTFTIGYSVSVTAGLPEVCQVNDDFSMSISLSDSETQSGSDTQTWSVSQTINIPPFSTIRAEMIVSTGQFNGEYTTTLTLDPNTFGSIWCNGPVNGHYQWWVPPPDFLDGNFGNNVVCSSGSCNITGVFSGIQGISVSVNVTQCPLNVQCS